MMSTPTAHDLRAVAVGRLLRRAFEDGAKWVAQVDDPARSRVSMDRGYAEFRESHYDAIIEIEAKTDTNLLQESSPSPGAVETPEVDGDKIYADARALAYGAAGNAVAPYRDFTHRERLIIEAIAEWLGSRGCELAALRSGGSR